MIRVLAILAFLLCLPSWSVAASPVVATSATTADQDGTSTVVNQPASATTGDLVGNFCAHNASTLPTISSGTNWVLRDQNTFVPGTSQSYSGWWKVLDGSGDNLTIAASSATTSCISVRITGHAVTDLTNHIVRGNSTGTSATPDPGNVDATLGLQDYLSLVVVWMDGANGANTFTPFSSGYTEVGQICTTGTLVCIMAERLAVTATAENPGTVTSNASNGWVTRTYLLPSTLTPASSDASGHNAAMFILEIP